jgi:hypothetical protein
MAPAIELRSGGQTFTLAPPVVQRDANCVRGFEDALSILHGLRGSTEVGRLRTLLARQGHPVASRSGHNDEGVYRAAALAVSSGELILRPIYAPPTADEGDEVDRQLASGKDVPEIVRSIVAWRGGNPFRRPEAVFVRVPFHAAWSGWVPESGPLTQAVRQQQSAFLQKVRDEFANFEPYVKGAFKATAEANGVKKRAGSAPGVAIPKDIKPRFSDEEVSYLVVRTCLWNAGYTDPAAVYGKDQIASPQEAKLMGVEIEHGVARRLLGPLARASAALDQVKQQNPERLSVELKLMGLQPRRVKNKGKLSNHAFGYAIDINPLFNPLMDKMASKIIQSRAEINFSALMRSGKSPEVIYTELKRASDKFCAWIKKALAAEPKLREIRNSPDYDPALFDPIMETGSVVELDILRAEARNGHLTGSLGYLQRSGFLMLPWDIIKALLDQQFTWGGLWEHDRRDFMHFDFAGPPLPPGPQRPSAK